MYSTVYFNLFNKFEKLVSANYVVCRLASAAKQAYFLEILEIFCCPPFIASPHPTG